MGKQRLGGSVGTPWGHVRVPWDTLRALREIAREQTSSPHPRARPTHVATFRAFLRRVTAARRKLWRNGLLFLVALLLSRQNKHPLLPFYNLPSSSRELLRKQQFSLIETRTRERQPECGSLDLYGREDRRFNAAREFREFERTEAAARGVNNGSHVSRITEHSNVLQPWSTTRFYCCSARGCFEALILPRYETRITYARNLLIH